MKKKLMEPKKMKVPAGPRDYINNGPSILVRKQLANRKAFKGPIVKGKHVSTG